MFEIELLILSIALGIPACYAVRCLILERKDSHEGIFSTNKYQVVFDEEVIRRGNDVELVEELHIQKVGMWDWIRRLFGAYEVTDRVWTVKDSWKAELWMCPFCLSFWIGFFFSVPLLVWRFESVGPALLWAVPVHLSIALVSTAIYGALFSD